LPQPVKGLLQLQHLVLCSLHDETGCLLDEDNLRQVSI
jgi:hypothetical protein